MKPHFNLQGGVVQFKPHRSRGTCRPHEPLLLDRPCGLQGPQQPIKPMDRVVCFL